MKPGLSISVLDNSWGKAKIRAYTGDASVVLWTFSENISKNIRNNENEAMFAQAQTFIENWRKNLLPEETRTLDGVSIKAGESSGEIISLLVNIAHKYAHKLIEVYGQNRGRDPNYVMIIMQSNGKIASSG